MSRAPLIEDFAEDFPDDELIVYRNTAVAVEGWPNGFECLITVPKAKLRALKAAGKQPPFWRHGESMNVTPPREGNDGAGEGGR